MVDAKKIEELRGLLAADTSTDWQTVRTDPAEGADVWWLCAKNSAGQEIELGSLQGGFPHPTREARARLICAMRNALPALLDLASKALATLSLAGEDAAGLCERLEKRAAFWERYWTGRSLQDPDSGPIREAAAMIRSLSLRVEAEKRAREEALAENARLARLVYVPGQWRCAKCKFTLIQANLNANDGTVTARDQPGDKCPNCDSPLWRVTERDAGNEMIDRAEEAFEAKRAAETHSAALARALEEARDELLECKADYHRNPSSVIDKCNAVLTAPAPS